MQLIDLTGQRFGRLTVIEKVPNHGKHVAWKCLCDCGRFIETTTSNLRGKHHTQSCGCLQRERTGNATRVHGMTKTRLHRVWCAMRNRCERTNNDNYAYYGGRGIKVCDEWKKFQPFMEWALSSGYADNLTLDRIDSDKDYYPENCRWATMHEQNSNKRNNHYLEFQGQIKTISDWSDITGIPRYTLLRRVNELGWNAEKALSTPPKRRINK